VVRAHSFAMGLRKNGAPDDLWLERIHVRRFGREAPGNASVPKRGLPVEEMMSGADFQVVKIWGGL
jgi:hypothetical protein